MIPDALAAQLRTRRQAPAVVDPEQALTYADLDGLSSAVALHLEQWGVTAGDPVIVHTRLSRWAVVAMLGVLRAGARYVPVDAAFPAARRELMISAGGASVILTEELLTSLPPVGCSPWRDGPDAYTMFTSGSTGVPKPVTVSRAALSYSTKARLEYYGPPPQRFLLCSSISFDSSVAGIYWTLCTGGTLIIPSARPFDVRALVRAGAAHRPTHTLMVPSLYRLALRAPMPSLSTVIVAGESCPPGLVDLHYERMPHAALYNEYGPTECTVWSTVHRCVQGEDPVPIGRPIPGTTVSIDDGELCISSPGVVSGGPVYRTGDRVSLGADGLLRYHGRVDEQLKVGGMRIEPAEIEHALMSHPAVLLAGVAVPYQGVAFVVCAEPVEPATLRAHLLDRLPAVAVPTVFERVPRLPTLPNGKLDRSALSRIGPAGDGPPRRAAAPAQNHDRPVTSTLCDAREVSADGSTHRPDWPHRT
ncbi:amino acid adenylation domain-containing protein [Micromonospora avicenniae]|uniref:AMP-binding enzyme C-terminal domain-containing protein n=1 Tax=Micromonospora avicenniae TaxID=1198245 RepID=A0A1N6ZRS2_9ACTN|nr:amino acid adenylation domain-containing protein [Micromonospora avicenniae]SIR29603.1 AMP-binding enzyme C-terminal domain-containing protein [Micromonospora avicenniae]